MNKKKILIVSRSFYPMNSPRSFRTTELAKEFARQGHKVIVITPKDQAVHSDFEKRYGLTIKDLGTPKWKAIELKGKGLKLFYSRVVRRFSNLLIQYPEIELQGLVKKALSRENGYDLLISVAVPYPIHWGVAMARTKSHPIAKVWVADCGDPFMGVENDTFKPPFYFKFVEKWFCRKADYIAVPTEGAKKGYYPEFNDKIKVIPQGFRFEDVKIGLGEVDNPVPTFAYAGGFIPGRRDPTEMLNFLIGLNCNFKFYVYTNTPALVLPYANISNDRIVLCDFVPRTELLSHLSKMDFVVNFENIGSKQTPSKLIDYAIIKKPILSVRTGYLDKELVSEFLSGQYNKQLKIPNLEQYRIENVYKKFLELV